MKHFIVNIIIQKQKHLTKWPQLRNMIDNLTIKSRLQNLATVHMAKVEFSTVGIMNSTNK